MSGAVEHCGRIVFGFSACCVVVVGPQPLAGVIDRDARPSAGLCLYVWVLGSFLLILSDR